MLTQLTIENFKSFGTRQSVPLAPLTLIFGGNSAGKSTVLQALLTLHQSIAPSGALPVGVNRSAELVIRGNYVDLGSFDALIHGHDRDRELCLGVASNQPSRLRLNKRTRRLTFPEPVGVDWSFAQDTDGRGIRHVSSTLHYGESRVDLRPLAREPVMLRSSSSGVIRPGDIAVLTPPETRDLLAWTRSGPHLMEFAPGIGPEPFPEQAPKTLPRSNARGTVQLSGGIPIEFLGFDLSSQGRFAIDQDDDLEVLSGQIYESKRSKMTKFERDWARWASVWLRTFPGSLRSELRRVAYLGPLRTPPERFNVLTGERVQDVGTSGERVVDMLARDSELLERLNEWFLKLEIPYMAEVRPVRDVAVAGAIGEVHCLLLRDIKTDTTVSPRDVGFGIGQVLPVVVQSLLNRNSLLCVEQPEIHLHPGLQARLGDMFASVIADGRGSPQFVLETHSEHLILRVQRLIRRGDLTPDQVSVVHVGPNDEGIPIVRSLRLDESGDFVDEWPGGFFDERFQELFGE